MQKSEKKLLILDLDETLIYGIETKLDREPDFIIGRYFIYKRPFLESFLSFCFENFDVAIWTTATKAYAEKILQTILRENHKLVFLWTRERCTLSYDEETSEHFFVKRINKLRRRGHDLESIIVIDDSRNAWESSYGNLVRVSRFEGDEADNELIFLPAYLEKLKDALNIRSIEKRDWRNRI